MSLEVILAWNGLPKNSTAARQPIPCSHPHHVNQKYTLNKAVTIPWQEGKSNVTNKYKQAILHSFLTPPLKRTMLLNSWSIRPSSLFLSTDTPNSSRTSLLCMWESNSTCKSRKKYCEYIWVGFPFSKLFSTSQVCPLCNYHICLNVWLFRVHWNTKIKSQILDGPQRFQFSRMDLEESAFLASTPEDCVNSKAWQIPTLLVIRILPSALVK